MCCLVFFIFFWKAFKYQVRLGHNYLVITHLQNTTKSFETTK